MTEQISSVRPVWRLADLAAYFGVTRTTIYEWRVAGRFEAITHLDPGGRPYFLADEVEAWARGSDLALSEDVA